jgi:hypothetical protein
MANQSQCGEANVRAKFTAASVREIRLRHIAGASCSELARESSVSCGQISKIVRWESWSAMDLDLKDKPRPVHKGGGSVPGFRNRVNEDQPESLGLTIRGMRSLPKRLCSECIHFHQGDCTLGFPECKSSNGRTATLCSVFMPEERK